MEGGSFFFSYWEQTLERSPLSLLGFSQERQGQIRILKIKHRLPKENQGVLVIITGDPTTGHIGKVTGILGLFKSLALLSGVCALRELQGSGERASLVAMWAP